MVDVGSQRRGQDDGSPSTRAEIVTTRKRQRRAATDHSRYTREQFGRSCSRLLVIISTTSEGTRAAAPPGCSSIPFIRPGHDWCFRLGSWGQLGAAGAPAKGGWKTVDVEVEGGGSSGTTVYTPLFPYSNCDATSNNARSKLLLTALFLQRRSPEVSVDVWEHP